MNNKQYELIILNLLTEKNINYKYQKTENRYKIIYDNVEYKFLVPDVIEYNGQAYCFKNGKDFIIKMNELIKFFRFNELLENIMLFEELEKKIKINDIQIKLFFPDKTKSIWYESCYFEKEGAIINFNYKENNYIFALEEKELEFLNLKNKKKYKGFSTVICNEEKLNRMQLFSDKDIEMISDACVTIYKDAIEYDKIKTTNIVNCIKGLINYEA